MKNSTKRNKLFSQFPWGYIESFIIVFVILIIGFILELFTSKPIAPPAFPRNLLIIILFIVYIGTTYYFIKHPLIEWLTTIPAAISAISLYTLLVLLMGFIQQEENNSFKILEALGLTHITTSWTYLLATGYLLIILGYTIAKRIRQFSRSFPAQTLRNLTFFLLHMGLWLIISSASLGTADLVRLVMPVNEGERTKVAFDEQNNVYKMPFTIELIDFIIEEYPPQRMTPPAVKNFSSYIIIISDSNGIQYKTQVKVNKAFSYKGWKIYQSGYDGDGKRSIFEVVKDPWLNAVYIGIYMLLAGAVLLFWLGKK